MKLEHPLRLGRGQNDRELWRAKAHRMKREKTEVGWLMCTALGPKPKPPVKFTLTRISPSVTPLDDDNLAGAWKAGRDAIAAWLGVDDGNKALVRFEYAQERGPWGVRIEWT